MFPSVSEWNILPTCMMETEVEVQFLEAEVEHTLRLKMFNKLTEAAAILINSINNLN